MTFTHRRAFFPATVFPLVLLVLLQSGNCRNSSSNRNQTAAATNSNTRAVNATTANRQTAASAQPTATSASEANANRATVNRNGAGDTNRREETSGMQGGENIATGIWGGAHIRLEVTGNGASVEFDCAHGSITQKLAVDASGAFTASGTYTLERGGPVRADETPASHPARYSGRVEGQRMTLRIRLTDSDTDIGSFTLTHGREARLTKCL